MRIYKDKKTGYEITQYTTGPERNAKLYFTTENFSVDDRYFFFNKQWGEDHPDGGLWRAELATGKLEQILDGAHARGFAMDRVKPYGVFCRDERTVCRLDTDTLKITEIGELPEGKVTGHLTTADTGRVACSFHQWNKIFALVILDPKTGESQIVHQSDHHLGHAQICPTDENLIFYIHETTGDALQRTWMFDVNNRSPRPYYVEHPNEWITHEVWSADGSELAFMKLRGQVIIGDKDGRHFDTIATGEQLLHPGLSMDKNWVCADRISYLGVDVQEGIVLINRHTGKMIDLAVTGTCKTGGDHQHPSFNRRGDMVLFSAPDENGIAQVCTIDLNQVQRP